MWLLSVCVKNREKLKGKGMAKRDRVQRVHMDMNISSLTPGSETKSLGRDESD